MIAGLVVFGLAAAAAAFVIAPLFRPGAAEAERVARSLSEAQDLDSQREMALAALRDLEDDHATGKIGESDYLELKGRLSARAVDILRRIDELEAPARPAPVPDPGPVEGAAEGR